jgi:translocation protein SEC66
VHGGSDTTSNGGFTGTFHLSICLIRLEHAQQLQREKASLGHLIKEGAIGEDVWNRIQRADDELSNELNEVIQEAETFKQGWGDEIMQEAARRIPHAHQQQQQQQPQEPQKSEKEKLADLAKKEKAAQRAMAELLAEEEAEKRKKEKQAPKKKK